MMYTLRYRAFAFPMQKIFQDWEGTIYSSSACEKRDDSHCLFILRGFKETL